MPCAYCGDSKVGEYKSLWLVGRTKCIGHNSPPGGGRMVLIF